MAGTSPAMTAQIAVRSPNLKTNTASGRGATGGRVVDAVFRSRDEHGGGAQIRFKRLRTRPHSQNALFGHSFLVSTLRTKKGRVRRGHLPLTRTHPRCCLGGSTLGQARGQASPRGTGEVSARTAARHPRPAGRSAVAARRRSGRGRHRRCAPALSSRSRWCCRFRYLPAAPRRRRSVRGFRN
jgi:hypothetical protein